MQPPTFRNSDVTLQLWNQYARHGQAIEPSHDELSPIVFRSWQRCSPRLDPLGTPQLSTLQADALRNVLTTRFDLIAIARPFMEDIYQFVEGSGYAVFLSDGATCVLDILGDIQIEEELRSLGLRQGTYWNEGSVGTNAVSLALQEAMPVQVVGPEHYFKLFHEYTFSAAPIHDVSGRIIGALAMAGSIDTVHSHTLATVMGAARAIENQLQTDLYLQEANRRLTELHSVFGAISEGILSWNKDGKITHINEQAGNILNVSPASVLGRHLDEVFVLPDKVHAATRTGDRIRDVEASIGVNERTVDCLVSTRPILEGVRGPVGHLMTLRPIKRVHKLVHRLVGAEATLTLEHVLGKSAGIQQVRHRARLAARGRASVLLSGEDGVGKNPLARAIHNESPRADGPFLSINCLAVPHELMVGEFLGYEGGAFSGARSDGRPSKFELADKGTLFLDEIDSLSLEMQAALLQVIDTNYVMRLGSTRAIPVDVRIVAASSADLEAKVADGNLRSDLYYRFGVFTITVPPLRERAEDIPLLTDRFLARISPHSGTPVELCDDALDVLMRYPWPGNIRELENVLERAVVHSSGGVIRAGDLPASVRDGRALIPDSPHPQPVLSIAEAERQAIIHAGYACNGKVTEMAQQLGIGRTTLWRKMKQFDITPDAFKSNTAV